MSLAHQGVRKKLLVAFALMSILPLLVLVYFAVTYVLPTSQWPAWNVVLVPGICGLITFLGFIVARDLVLPVLRVAQDAKRIANGEALGSVQAVTRQDELGELEEALTHINQRILGQMAQLRDYGEHIQQLNTEIHQRVLVLSHLLQVGNLISQGVSLNEVLDCVVEKLSETGEGDLYALLVPVAEDPSGGALRCQIVHSSNPQHAALLRGRILHSPWLEGCLKDPQAPLVVDERHRLPHEVKELERLFGLTHGLGIPIVSRGRGLGLIVTGNRRPQTVYAEGTVEILQVFSKQVAIAMESDRLSQRALALSVTDELTGLYNERYLRARLEEEVTRAALHHRPCSLVLLTLDDFGRVSQAQGTLAAEQILKQVAQLLLGQVTVMDKVARIGDAGFGVILPERTKREAIAVAERLRGRVGGAVFTVEHGGDARYSLTISGGVSENPLDGATADELWTKAEGALQVAKQEGKNQVVVC